MSLPFETLRQTLVARSPGANQTATSDGRFVKVGARAWWDHETAALVEGDVVATHMSATGAQLVVTPTEVAE